MAPTDGYTQALAALNFTDASAAFAGGFYVPPPPGLASDVSEQLRAEPGAQLMLLGSVGTGKTTWLRAAEHDLQEDDALAPFYADVSQYVRLSRPRAGVLVALAALAQLRLLRAAGAPVPEHLRMTTARLHGGLLAPAAEGDQGLLDRALLRDEPDALGLPPASVPDLERAFEELGVLEHDLKTRNRLDPIAARPPVLLLDGLDRVTTASALNEFTREDLPVLRRMGVAVVIAGSAAWRFRLDRDLPSWTGTVAWSRVPDVDREADRRFLAEVIRRRVSSERIDDAVAELIARGTGGVLRDLLATAKSALVRARRGGRTRADGDDARAALASLSERRMLFLSPERLEVVRAIEAHDRLQGHDQALEDLLASGDVLVRSLPDGYVVHPATRAALDLPKVA